MIKGSYLKKETTENIIQDYNNGVSIPDILEKYSISREKLGYLRNRYKIPERNTRRATTLKSITLEYKGVIKTYPSVEAASSDTKIPSDFLHKLKKAETFCEGKYSREPVIMLHDLNRLQDLEKASEVMGKILSEGTVSDKFQWGQELKNLLYKLGYAKEEDVELTSKT